MEKISPLKASLETFRQFKIQRAEKNENSKAHSNPFGITFKGTMLNMDVFESSSKKTGSGNAIENHFPTMAKFVASARVATINKFNSIKNSVVSFGGKIKQDAAQMMEKITNPETYALLNPQYSVTMLGKRPVTELEAMLKEALAVEGV